MGTSLLTGYGFSWIHHQRTIPNSQKFLVQSSRGSEIYKAKFAKTSSKGSGLADEEEARKLSEVIKRRSILVSSGFSLCSSVVVLGFPFQGLAEIKQGLLAGRVPGLSEPDEQG